MSSFCFVSLGLVSVSGHGRSSCQRTQGMKNRRHGDKWTYSLRKIKTRFPFPIRMTMKMKLRYGGVLEQKKTLLCVITCFLTGVYPVAFSYLFFSVPAIFVGAPPSLAGLFSIFTSAALELLYGGTWTVTQWFLYLCFIVCVLWDAYETIHPAEEEHKQEEHESSKGFTRKEDSESISLFQSWDERFHKAVMLKERSKDQRKTPY